MRRKLSFPFVLLFSLFFAFGCSDYNNSGGIAYIPNPGPGGTSGNTTNTTLSAIQVYPVNSRIAPNTQVQLFAVGILKSGGYSYLNSSVNWTTSSSAQATVSNTNPTQGVVTGLQPGTVTITATDPASGLSASATVTITSATLQGISVQPAASFTAPNSFRNFTAIGSFSDGSVQTITSSVSWSSNNLTVATISNTAPNQGFATTGAGSSGVTVTNITATDPTTHVNTTVPMSVSPSTVTLQSLTITPSNQTVPVGTPLTFVVEGVYSDGSVQNLSRFANLSSTSGFPISNTPPTVGQGIATSAGVATISANFGGLSATTTVTVTSANLSSITLSPVNPQISVNTTVNLAATGVYSDNSSQSLTNGLVWSSSNTGVAAVSNTPNTQGQVFGVSPGTATITGTSPTNPAISVSTTVTVFQSNLNSLALTPLNPVSGFGQTVTFAATGIFANNATQKVPVAWTSSNAAVATISTSGVASVVGQTGTTTITATYLASGASVSTSTNLTASLVQAAPQSITITPGIASLKGPAPKFVATGNYADGSTSNLTNLVTWSSSTPSVAGVSNNPRGQSNLVSKGTATITAILPISSGTNVTGTSTFTVINGTAQALALGATNFTLPVGVSRTISATETFSDGTNTTSQTVTGQVTYTSSNTSVAVVSDSTRGQVTGLATGNTTITVADPVTGLTNSTTVNVTAATLTALAINPNDGTGTLASIPSVPLGFTRQFTVTGTFSDASTATLTDNVIWSTGTPSVAQVSNNNSGLVTGLTAGTTSLSVAYPGTAITNSTQVQVRQEALLVEAFDGIDTFPITAPLLSFGSPIPATTSPASFGGTSGKGVLNMGLDANGEFLAETQLSNNVLNVWLEGSGGATHPHIGSNIATGNGPGPIVFNSAASLLYVLNEGDGAVQAFNYTSSAVAAVATPTAAVVGVVTSGDNFMAIAPNGKWLLVLGNNGGAPQINLVDTAASGAMTAKFNAALTGNPQGLLVDVSNKFAYILDPTAGTISTYAVNGTSFNTAPVSTASLPANFFNLANLKTTGFLPTYMVQDPAGSIVYVLSNNNTIQAYADNGGVLTALGSTVSTGSAGTTGNGSFAITLDGLGRYLFVANQVDLSVSGYVVDGSAGILSTFPTNSTTTGAVGAGAAH